MASLDDLLRDPDPNGEGRLVTVVYRHKTTIGSLELDASLSETHSYEQDVTEHPIEDGSVIADHIRLKPETVRIEGFVSNTPIGKAPDTSRVENAFAILRKIRAERQPVTIATRLHTYENMVLKRLEIPRDVSIGTDAIKFTADFSQILTVTGQTNTVSIIKDPGRKSKSDLGSQPKKATPEKLKSVFRSTEDGFGALLPKFKELAGPLFR